MDTHAAGPPLHGTQWTSSVGVEGRWSEVTSGVTRSAAPQASRNRRTRRCASRLKALASSHRGLFFDARRKTLGDDQISRTKVLFALADHSLGGPRWKCLRSPRQWSWSGWLTKRTSTEWRPAESFVRRSRRSPATSGVPSSGSSAADRIFMSMRMRRPDSVVISVMSPFPTGKKEICPSWRNSFCHTASK